MITDENVNIKIKFFFFLYLIYAIVKDPYPKGEIFLGCHNDGFSVGEGADPSSNYKVRDQGFSFHLKTPSRCFWFSAERADDREEWINLLNSVLQRPMSPQDTYCRSNFKTSRKRYFHF